MLLQWRPSLEIKSPIWIKEMKDLGVETMLQLKVHVIFFHELIGSVGFPPYRLFFIYVCILSWLTYASIYYDYARYLYISMVGDRLFYLARSCWGFEIKTYSVEQGSTRSNEEKCRIQVWASHLPLIYFFLCVSLCDLNLGGVNH